MWQKIKELAQLSLSDYFSIRNPHTRADYRTIGINYPPKFESRYGYDKPIHAQIYSILDRNRRTYQDSLNSILIYKDSLLEIGSQPTSAKGPNFRQPWLPGLDAAALYSIIRSSHPNRYVEIGSGHSTLFAKAAIRDEQLKTTMVSIDPAPRAEIDAIADQIFRGRLEDMDLSVFEDLDCGDILFFDGSHRCFTNSDVTVFFLEVLPLLRPGVAVQIHDIFWPNDYPKSWGNRYYSEQYLLGCLILAEPKWMEIILPNSFVSNDSDLMSLLDPLWTSPEMEGISRGGGSFWLRKR